MRIGTYNMVNQIYNTTGTKKSGNKMSTGYASFTDEISFSALGKDMQTAKNALAATPDVREARISDIKARMDNGTYSVSNDDFAAKLMETFAAKGV